MPDDSLDWPRQVRVWQCPRQLSGIAAGADETGRARMAVAKPPDQLAPSVGWLTRQGHRRRRGVESETPRDVDLDVGMAHLAWKHQSEIADSVAVTRHVGRDSHSPTVPPDACHGSSVVGVANIQPAGSR